MGALLENAADGRFKSEEEPAPEAQRGKGAGPRFYARPAAGLSQVPRVLTTRPVLLSSNGTATMRHCASPAL